MLQNKYCDAENVLESHLKVFMDKTTKPIPNTGHKMA